MVKVLAHDKEILRQTYKGWKKTFIWNENSVIKPTVTTPHIIILYKYIYVLYNVHCYPICLGSSYI